ncbi:hypothetical protein ACFQLX_03030 [Streptomyces polyrhachis]|uniref:Uncharacterized protein n=1 Tax=Streptomyces polyrhachis TaxID=1282885 RepID=A0ABW2GBD2_9ACTN
MALGAGLLGAVLLVGQLLPPTGNDLDGRSADKAKSAKGRTDAAVSGPDLNEENLGSRVRELIAGSAQRSHSDPPGTAAAESAPTESAAPLAGEPPHDPQPSTAVPPCVRSAVPASGDPLAVERESVRGMPALLLLFPRPGEPAYVDAYVVDLRCASEANAQAELLLRDTYRRP